MIEGSEKLEGVLKELDETLVGLEPVKKRIREIGALLIIERLREKEDLKTARPSLHMSFTGKPGTGKTTVAMRMAQILQSLGYIEKAKVVTVTRDDLVGQYVGHTAPKTREVLKKAIGGVLFIDEAYYLYRPENERDYGQEAIEVLLQIMEEERDNLVVVLAGYADRMDVFFRNNPGMGSRVAHHIHFPDYTQDELLAIGEMMLDNMGYTFSDDAREAFCDYITARVEKPRFANGRSIRNALDRARLRQANRLYEDGEGTPGREQLMELEADDILQSSVFEHPAEAGEEPEADSPEAKGEVPDEEESDEERSSEEESSEPAGVS